VEESDHVPTELVEWDEPYTLFLTLLRVHRA
jgi:hypothetical protein